MSRIEVDAVDQEVRGALTRLIAKLGHAPSLERLSSEVGLPPAQVEHHLQRLADAHALLLHPGTTRPWAVHPFALAPGSCWVATPALGYWANCLYCAFGIAAALDCDASITTRYGGEADTASYTIRGSAVEPATGLFHLSTPAARWWDNVVFACSSFQPFRSDGEIDQWCTKHDLPRGATMSIQELWAFASDWYGSYLTRPWKKRSLQEARALFEKHGLVGPFWRL